LPKLPKFLFHSSGPKIEHGAVYVGFMSSSQVHRAQYTFGHVT